MTGEMTPTQYEYLVRGIIDTGIDDGVDLLTIKEGLVSLFEDCVCPIAKSVVQRVLQDMRGNEPLQFNLKGMNK